MLVSSIARFEAVNSMNNYSYNLMESMNNLLNVTNHRSFGGEHDLNLLNQIDKRLSLAIAQNSLLYKIAYLQEKMFSKMQNNELDNKSVNYFA